MTETRQLAGGSLMSLRMLLLLLLLQCQVRPHRTLLPQRLMPMAIWFLELLERHRLGTRQEGFLSQEHSNKYRGTQGLVECGIGSLKT